MLKSGDTFVNQDFTALCAQSGKSATEPFVMTSYGTGARPIVEPASGQSTVFYTSTGGSCSGGEYANGAQYWAIMGIEFYNYTWDPNNGSYSAESGPSSGTFNNVTSWMLIENCMFEFVSLAIASGGNYPSYNGTIILNRNQILDNYVISSDISGIGLASTEVFNFWENVFDHNGWNGSVSDAGASTLSHNWYINCGTNVGNYDEVTNFGNWSTNGAAGDQNRCGWIINNDAYINNPGGPNFGNPQSQTTYIQYNTFWGQFSNTTQGGSVTAFAPVDSITSPYDSYYFNQGTTIIQYNVANNSQSTPTQTFSGSGVVNIDSTMTGTTIENNVFCGFAPTSTSGSPEITDDDSSTITGNYQKSANCNSGSWVGGLQPTLTDPNRSPGSYYASLSLGSANATFTGVISSGVLTVTGISGTLNVGDAITYSGQTVSDFVQYNSSNGSGTSCGGSSCTGTGGNGTYALAGTESQTSISMSSWTYQQLVNAVRSNNMSNWNSSLTACKYNTYILAGFGISDPCTP